MNLLELAPKEALQIAVPERTASYQPVSNRDLITSMQNVISSYGMKIVGADMQITGKGQQFMGTVKFESEVNCALQMQLGFRNSYNKSFAVGFGAGANVIVCGNGIFMADVKSVRKHTSMVWRDIEQVCGDQLRYIDDTFQELKNDMFDMEHTMMSTQQISKVITKLWIDEKVLTAQQMNIMRDGMFSEGNFKMYDKNDPLGPGNAWYMYNNITEALKVSHPTKYFKNHEKVHEIFKEFSYA